MKTTICCFGPAKTVLYLLLIVFFTPLKNEIECFPHANGSNSSSIMVY